MLRLPLGEPLPLAALVLRRRATLLIQSPGFVPAALSEPLAPLALLPVAFGSSLALQSALFLGSSPRLISLGTLLAKLVHLPVVVVLGRAVAVLERTPHLVGVISLPRSTTRCAGA